VVHETTVKRGIFLRIAGGNCAEFRCDCPAGEPDELAVERMLVICLLRQIERCEYPRQSTQAVEPGGNLLEGGETGVPFFTKEEFT